MLPLSFILFLEWLTRTVMASNNILMSAMAAMPLFKIKGRHDGAMLKAALSRAGFIYKPHTQFNGCGVFAFSRRYYSMELVVAKKAVEKNPQKRYTVYHIRHTTYYLLG